MGAVLDTDMCTGDREAGPAEWAEFQTEGKIVIPDDYKSVSAAVKDIRARAKIDRDVCSRIFIQLSPHTTYSGIELHDVRGLRIKGARDGSTKVHSCTATDQFPLHNPDKDVSCTLERCTITGAPPDTVNDMAGGTGVLAGPNSALRLIDCKVEGTRGIGAYVSAGGKLHMIKCKVLKCRGGGVLAKGKLASPANSQPELHLVGCKVKDCKLFGVSSSFGATVRLMNRDGVATEVTGTKMDAGIKAVQGGLVEIHGPVGQDVGIISHDNLHEHGDYLEATEGVIKHVNEKDFFRLQRADTAC